MPYGQLFAPQIGPAQGAEFAKQHSSAMRCVPRTDAVVLAAVPRRDIKSETRSVSFLISLREGMDKPSSADGSVDAVTKPVDTVTGMTVVADFERLRLFGI